MTNFDVSFFPDAILVLSDSQHRNPARHGVETEQPQGGAGASDAIHDRPGGSRCCHRKGTMRVLGVEGWFSSKWLRAVLQVLRKNGSRQMLQITKIHRNRWISDVVNRLHTKQLTTREMVMVKFQIYIAPLKWETHLQHSRPNTMKLRSNKMVLYCQREIFRFPDPQHFFSYLGEGC